MANEVEIVVRDRDKTGPGFNSATKKAGGLGRTLGRVGETAAGFLVSNVVQKGFDTFKDYVSGSIEESSRLNESLNAVSKIFGSSAPTILKWGKNNAASFGLSQQAFNELATPLGAGLKNAGLSLQDTSKYTIDLTKRAADMASVFNTSVPEALDAIQAGLRGEADPLEKFGVGLSAAAVQAHAVDLGLVKAHGSTAKLKAAQVGLASAQAAYTKAVKDHGKTSLEAQKADAAVGLAQEKLKTATQGTVPQLTKQQQTMAALDLIMQQTKSTAGDFKSTSDQLANSTRIEQAKSEELQATIGTKLTPVMLALNQAKLALVTIIADKVLPVVDQLSAWAAKHTGLVKVLAAVVGGVLVVALVAYAAAAASAAVATIAATWPILAIIAAVAALAIGIYLLVKNWSKVWGAVKSIVSAAGHFIMGLLRRYVGLWLAPIRAFIGGARAAWNGLASLVSRARTWFGQVKSAISAKLNEAIRFVRGIPGKIKHALGNTGSMLYSAGKNIIYGLVRGIRAAAGRAVSAARGVVSDAISGAKRLLHINSPSKVAEKELGMPIGEGVAVGMHKARGIVAAAGATMAGSAISGGARAVGRGTGGGGRVVLELRSGGTRLDDLLVEVMRKAVRARGGNVQVVLGKG